MASAWDRNELEILRRGGGGGRRGSAVVKERVFGIGAIGGGEGGGESSNDGRGGGEGASNEVVLSLSCFRLLVVLAFSFLFDFVSLLYDFFFS